MTGLTTRPAAPRCANATCACMYVCGLQVRGMEKTIQHLVKELQQISVPIRTDKDMLSVASVAAGGLQAWGPRTGAAVERNKAVPQQACRARRLDCALR